MSGLQRDRRTQAAVDTRLPQPRWARAAAAPPRCHVAPGLRLAGLLLLAGMLGQAMPAHAAPPSSSGLSGGYGGGVTTTSGNGGASNAGGNGAPGQAGGDTSGNGGGGGGGGGVNGGDGAAGFSGAPGGAGATTAGGSGSLGSTGTTGGGGGGGGGAHGAAVTSTTTNSGTIVGGNGGAGGNGGTSSAGGGGGGGAGGFGVVVNGAVTATNIGTITGGNGAAGGLGSFGDSAGAGGAGGYGVAGTAAAEGGALINNGSITGGSGGTSSGSYAAGGNGADGITGSILTINNTGSITGGNGGAGTGTNAGNGVGGAGITGSDLNVTNSGSITGGLAGDGVTQANAITFTGGTNTLTLQSGSAISGNVVAASTNDTLILGGSSNASFNVSTIGTQYQGFGNFQAASSATWTLTGSTTANTSWLLTSGALSISSAGNLGTGSLTMGEGTGLTVTAGGTYGNALFFGLGDPTVTIASGQTVVWSGPVSGFTTGLVLNGPGTLELSNNGNNWSGPTTLTAGTLEIGANNALGDSGNTLAMQAGTTLSFDPTGSFTVSNNITVSGDPNFVVQTGNSQVVSGTISDGTSPGSVNVSGGGSIALTGANTYSGGTTICGTTCGAAGGSTIVDVTNSTPGTSSSIGTGTLTFDGGTLQGDGTSLTFSNAVQLTSNGGIIDLNGVGITLTGNVTDAAGFSGGPLTVESSTTQGTPVLTLSGINTYSGTTSILSGSVVAGSTAGLSPNSAFQVNSGATLDLGGFNNTIVSLADGGGGGGTVTNQGASAAILTISGTSGTTTFSGSIQDGANALGLTKVGGSTQVLSGTNTYSGATEISGGTLALVGTGTIANSSNVDIAASATFDISGANSNQTEQINGLTGAVGSTVQLGANTLTVAMSTNDTFGGVLKDGGAGGGLSVGGAGTLALTQAQNYLGATTISGGTLALTGAGSIAQSSGVIMTSEGAILDISETSGTTVQSLSSTGFFGTVNLGNQALTVAVASGTDTFGGVLQDGGISGLTGGSLVKTGAGTLLLTNNNTYTGGTTVNAGILQLGTGNALSTSGALAVNGGTFDLNGFSQTVGKISGTGGTIALSDGGSLSAGDSSNTILASTITGSGFFFKEGTGTLSVTGNNTFSGGFTVEDGTLSISSESNLGTGILHLGNLTTLAITASGTFTNAMVLEALEEPSVAVASGQTATWSGVISGTSGTSALTADGLGTLILTAANTYAGGTTVSSGTLSAANASALGSGAATVTSGGTLNINGVTIGNAISLAGSGASGFGALTGTGSAGASGPVTLTANAAVGVANASDTLTLTGAVTDGGSTALALTKLGAGTLLMDGNGSAFAGTTAVTAGTLEVGDASHASATLGGSVTVASGGTLMGHGTLGGNLSNGGAVQPGGTIGVLTVAGNYTQSSAGTLTIEITPNVAAGPGVGYSQLSVGGTASLNSGMLSIIDDPGTYSLGSRYTIVTAAGGVSGTFASPATFNPIFAGYITPHVTYDANDVYLALDPTPSPPPPGAPPGTPPAAPPPLFNGGQEVPDMLTAMISAAEGVADTVLGDVCGSEAQRYVTQGQGCVVRPLAAGYQSEVWMRGLGGLGNLTGGGSHLSFSDNYGGLLIGAGVNHGGFTVGAGGGYLATTLSFSDGGDASQNAGLGFVYGRYAQGPWWVGAMAAYGGGQVNGDRVVPGTGLTATGNRSSDFAIVQARAAYDLAVGPMTIEPRASLAYIHAGQDGFAESGASLLDLTYSDTNADTVEGRLTARALQRFAVGTWALVPWLEGGVQAAFSGLSRGVVATDGAFSAAVSGVSPAPAAGVIGVGIDVAASDKLDVFLRYQGLFSANQTENAFSAGLSMRF